MQQPRCRRPPRRTCLVCVLPRCATSIPVRTLVTDVHQPTFAPPPPLHVDAAGQEVLDLLRANFAGCTDMRMIAMYGSAAFKQISAEDTEAKATTATPAAAAAAPAPSSAAAPMLDLIFAVDDPVSFHLSNMRLNPSHYSFLRFFRSWPALIGWVQEYGAGVWYNTLIDMPVGSGTDASGAPATRLIKYGVISTQRLMDDLTQWESMYIAGRMHKPMHLLVCSPSIQFAAQCNLRSALSTALLLLDCEHDTHKPTTIKAAAKAGKTVAAAAKAGEAAQEAADIEPTVTVAAAADPPDTSSAPPVSSFVVPLRALLSRIASLSYFGDIRMGLAENPHKVANIVTGSWAQMVELYAPHIAAVRAGGGGDAHTQADAVRNPTDTLQLPCDPNTRATLLATLPRRLQAQIQLADGWTEPTPALPTPRPAPLPVTQASPSSSPRVSAYWHSFAVRPAATRQQLLSGALASIVSQSSKQQTAKGLATAGFRKSFRYGLAKFKKAMLKR